MDFGGLTQNEIDKGKVYLIKRSDKDYELLIRNTMAAMDALALFGFTFVDKNINLKIIGGHGLLNAYTSFNSVQLNRLDLSEFDSSHIIDMGEMFLSCKIKHLDLGNLDTSNARYMQDMFSGCETDLIDLTNFNTRNVEDISYMFYKCNAKEYNLGSLDLLNCTSASNVFEQCNATELDISGWQLNILALNNIMADKPHNLQLKA